MADKLKLPMKKVKGRIKVWKVTPYKDSMIYVRQIDEDLFEYLVAWGGQIYGDYMIVTPEEGKKKLAEQEKLSAFTMILTAATTTVDVLRGEGVTGAAADEAKGVMDVFFPKKKKKEPAPEKLTN